MAAITTEQAGGSTGTGPETLRLWLSNVSPLLSPELHRPQISRVHRTESMTELTENDGSRWLLLIHQFLQEFGWLADSFVLDFFVHDHWSRLPQTWRDYLPTLTPDRLADLIDLDSSTTPQYVTPPGSSPAPLSLAAFKQTVRVLSLSRKCDDQAGWPATNHDHDFKNLINRHVKLKKRHELERVRNVISELVAETKATHVFDVGSGLGHLSRFLAYRNGLTITCVEAEHKFTESATKLDNELKSFVDKKNRRTNTGHEKELQACSHVTVTLELNKHEQVFASHPEPFGMTGLHSCGNLSSVILHNFVNSPARFAVSLGCCYMKLDRNGFPLSQPAKSLGMRLTYEALEVACHAIEQYCARLRSGQVNKLKTHSYRATLETILVTRGIKRAGLRGVPHTEKLPFAEYARQATRHLVPPLDLSDSEVTSPATASHMSRWFNVVLFYSLRLAVANVVETAVLVDRAVFLRQSPCSHSLSPPTVRIVPLFDPAISPRNLAIICHRHDSGS